MEVFFDKPYKEVKKQVPKTVPVNKETEMGYIQIASDDELKKMKPYLISYLESKNTQYTRYNIDIELVKKIFELREVDALAILYDHFLVEKGFKSWSCYNITRPLSNLDNYNFLEFEKRTSVGAEVHKVTYRCVKL